MNETLTPATVLAEERRQRGWTLREVASSLGVAFSYVSNLEKGNHVPSLTLARRFAALYGVDVDDLFPPTDDERAILAMLIEPEPEIYDEWYRCEVAGFNPDEMIG